MKNRSSYLFLGLRTDRATGPRPARKRSSVVQVLGVNGVQLIFGHADVFHCEPIEKVSDDMSVFLVSSR